MDPSRSSWVTAPGALDARPRAELVPGDRENVPVVHDGPAATLLPGQRFRVLTWNIQFAGTRRHHFFYDGGDAVAVPADDVREALDGIVAVLARLDPDVALLQEVDRRSGRTGYVDELDRIHRGFPAARRLSTSIHRSAWVPHPLRHQLGPVDLHQAVLSRFELDRGVRIALPPLREPALRQAFNLHRALLVGTGPDLTFATTHLSAFSRGDGTLPAQVARIVAWIDGLRGRPWLLGGDFNLLPPDDDPRRLGDEAAEYADHPSPLLPLFARGRSVIPEASAGDPQPRTYLPPGADAPDRVLDWIFVSPHLTVERAWVEPVPAWLSDHRPIVADLRWTPPEGSVVASR